MSWGIRRMKKKDMEGVEWVEIGTGRKRKEGRMCGAYVKRREGL